MSAARNILSALERFRFTASNPLPPGTIKILVIYDRFNFFTKPSDYESLIGKSYEELIEYQQTSGRRFLSLYLALKIDGEVPDKGYFRTTLEKLKGSYFPPESTIILQHDEEVFVWKVDIPTLKIPHMYDKDENMCFTVKEIQTGRPISWSGEWGIPEKLYIQFKTTKGDQAYQLWLNLDKGVNFFHNSSKALDSDHVGEIHSYTFVKLFFYDLSKV